MTYASSNSAVLALPIAIVSLGISAICGLASGVIPGMTLIKKRRHSLSIISDSLPKDLMTWRQPGASVEAEEEVWRKLDPVLKDAGFTQWPHYRDSYQTSVDLANPIPNGYAYATPRRGIEKGIGTVRKLQFFPYRNPLCRAVRTLEGYDVIMRVIVHKDEGRNHLEILRQLTTGPHAFLTSNHTLPMLQEFELQHITFGLFPRVGASMTEAYGFWPRNSAGDVLDMVMQALEGLEFIHSMKIAHRDAFRDNFLVEWHPESLRANAIPISRPRVYLVDFEVAVSFGPDSLPEQMVCTGYPIGGSFRNLDMYSRPGIPEMDTGEPYDPFKLDVWQFGTSLLDLKSTFDPIDDVLAAMAADDPAARMSAKDASSKLGSLLNELSPRSLFVKPKALSQPFEYTDRY